MTNAVIVKIDGEHLVTALKSAMAELAGAEGELVLDFSDVHRMDADAIKALEALADSASQKGLKLLLRGVSVETYRVLKLVQLSPRLSFLE